MKLGILLLGTTVGMACGDNGENGNTPQAIESLFPANNIVGAWVENTSEVNNNPGVDKAMTSMEAEGFINGDAEPFIARSFVAFGREYYTNGTYTLELRAWEMKDMSVSQQLYDALITEDARYSGSTWENVPSLGDAGRVADTGSAWWVNTRKKAYFVEAQAVQPNDQAGKTAAIDFVKAVVALIQ